MRIAYACYWSVYRLDGVAKKITTQVDHWRAAGHDVETFALTPAGRDREQRWPAEAYPFHGAADRVRAGTRMLRALRRFRPDVVYLRYELLPPPLQSLPRVFPTVVELNSDEHAEYAFRARLRGMLANAYGRWNWQRLFAPAAGIVCVTNELVRLVAAYRRPTAVIANGIALDGIPELPPASGPRPTLVFSGTPGQRWHGIDKLVELARLCPELDVIVLGQQPADAPPNLESHSFLPRELYEPLLARADAALGTAALHRNGMTEAAPLKVREYLAYGLPVVVPYDDTDLRDLDDWFLLRLPNEERNLAANAAAIVDFVERAKGRRVPREAVESRIGAAAKEAARLDFLERVRRA